MHNFKGSVTCSAKPFAELVLPATYFIYLFIYLFMYLFAYLFIQKFLTFNNTALSSPCYTT